MTVKHWLLTQYFCKKDYADHYDRWLLRLIVDNQTPTPVSGRWNRGPLANHDGEGNEDVAKQKI